MPRAHPSKIDPTITNGMNTNIKPGAALAALSAMPRAEFVGHLGDIFEHSPWIAERAWAARPFASIEALHAAMVAAVDHASEAEQLGLIRAHPELAGKEAAAGTLTAASTGEQRGAGLDQCSADRKSVV